MSNLCLSHTCKEIHKGSFQNKGRRMESTAPKIILTSHGCKQTRRHGGEEEAALPRLPRLFSVHSQWLWLAGRCTCQETADSPEPSRLPPADSPQSCRAIPLCVPIHLPGGRQSWTGKACLHWAILQSQSRLLEARTGAEINCKPQNGAGVLYPGTYMVL